MSWIIEFAGNIEYCYESQNTVDKANIINYQEIPKLWCHKHYCLLFREGFEKKINYFHGAI